MSESERERDEFILDTLLDLLDGLESASLLEGASANEVSKWLIRRHAVYRAVIKNGLIGEENGDLVAPRKRSSERS